MNLQTIRAVSTSSAITIIKTNRSIRRSIRRNEQEKKYDAYQIKCTYLHTKIIQDDPEVKDSTQILVGSNLGKYKCDFFNSNIGTSSYFPSLSGTLQTSMKTS